MRRLLLSSLAVIALGVGLAVAQNVQQQLNGPEAWQVGIGGPGGPGVPTAPFDGQIVIVSCPGGAISTLTVSAPNTLAPPMTITGPASVSCSATIPQSMSLVYLFSSTSPATWNRLQ